ncbi:hypothetical protein EPO15_05445, partial [bacterium]
MGGARHPRRLGLRQPDQPLHLRLAVLHRVPGAHRHRLHGPTRAHPLGHHHEGQHPHGRRVALGQHPRRHPLDDLPLARLRVHPVGRALRAPGDRRLLRLRGVLHRGRRRLPAAGAVDVQARREVIRFALVLALWAAPARASVFIVRHAERADAKADKSLLSRKGKKRAELLSKVLGGVPLKAVYTTEYERTQQTAGPTAKAQGLAVTVTDSEKAADLAAELKLKPAET